MLELKGRPCRYLVIPILILVIVAAACGGGEGDEETPTPESSPTATTPATATSTPVPAATSTPTAVPQPTPTPLEPYTSQVHGITLLIPEGWVTDDSDPDTLTISNPTGIADIEIRFNTFLAEPNQAQFDEFVSLGILSLREEFPGFEEISRERLTGRPGFIIAFKSENFGLETGVVALYTYNNVRGVLALASTEGIFFQNFQALFEQVLKTVSVVGTPPGPTPTPAPTPSPTPTPVATPTPFPTIAPGLYTNDRFDFDMVVPLGWGMLDSGKEAEVRFIGPGGVIVQVLTAKLPAGMTNAVYTLVLVENRYEPLTGFTRVSEGDVTHETLAARELRFTARTGLDGATQEYLVLVTKRGIRAYIIEAIGPESAFEDLQTEIEAFVASFRL